MKTFDADALMLHMDASKFVRNNTAYAHGWNDALEYYIHYIAANKGSDGIVRCRDCIHRKGYKCQRVIQPGLNFDIAYAMVKQDHFCGYGERRKDATD